MNASAVAIFGVLTEVKWITAAVYSAGRSWEASSRHMVRKVNERVLRLLVVLIGLTLT